MDTTFDQNKSEFRVFIFLVSLQVLSDRHGLLDKLIQILWDLWCKACSKRTRICLLSVSYQYAMRSFYQLLQCSDTIVHHDLTSLLQDTQDLVASHTFDLSNSVGVTKDDTNLWSNVDTGA